MEYLFVLFIVIIVIITGYVLSQPFSKRMDQSDETSRLDHKRQYQSLLEEIRRIEKDCESGTIPNDDCVHQIREKKSTAAHLLRVIDPTLENEHIIGDEIRPSQLDQIEPAVPFPSQGSYFCPQCGDQVLNTDKFCMHCGHRLKS